MNLKYVLYKPGSHGLGNKLLVLSTAIGICRKHRVQLVIDWKGALPDRDDFWSFFRLVNCRDLLAPSQDPALLNGLSSAQNAWEGRFEQDIPTVYADVTRSGEFPCVDLQEIPPMSGLLTYFKGQKQKDVLVLSGYSSCGQRPDLLLRHLRFALAIEKQLEVDLKELIGHRRGNQLVGLHVRAASASFLKPNYSKIVRNLQAKPEAVLMMASDSEEEQENLAAKLKSRVICIAKHFPKTPSTYQHSNEPLALHMMDFDPSTGTSLDGYRYDDVIYQSILDWCMVSSCSTIYWQPGSTFSLLILLFGRSVPWRAVPHCESSWKTRLYGYYWSALKYKTKSFLIPPVQSS
jgi:hypothetical protein